ncbi:DegQ family serine endoprotease [Thermodesulfobacteriota bacterium]
MDMNKTRTKRAFFIVLSLFIGFMAAVYIYPDAQVYAGPADAISVPGSFNQLAEKVSPSVVNIRTVKTIKGGGRVFRNFHRRPQGNDDPFQDFFDRFFGNGPQREFKQRSLGSGFIIDQNGYIVTNNHVVEHADEIQIKLKNGNEYEADIVGRDPSTDLALLKIEAKHNFPFVALGNSDDLNVGEWVVAIGSPFGLEHTVTAGIVSAKGRVIGSGPYDDFIQTDASINPGNSGGPLINMKGEVVGINTAIIAGGTGIGFAVPVNDAKGVIQQLKEKGEVTRGWLGVSIQDVSEEVSDYYQLKSNEGALVAEVFEGDPADLAGIKPGDIIVEVNGEKIKSSRDLTGFIASVPVGGVAGIKVLRDGKSKTFKVKIAKREDNSVASHRYSKETAGELGIQVSNITPDMARRFKLGDTQGVIITDVEPGSKGSEAGVQAGDVIKEVNHHAVNTVETYQSVLGKIKKGEAIHLFILRRNVGFLVVRLEK